MGSRPVRKPSCAVLVYGGWGSFVIDAASGRVSDPPILTGYGATASVDSRVTQNPALATFGRTLRTTP
ncbi:MAG: hypothetical protein NVSMB2_06780 [Chloroflexota bacterium]